MVDQPNGARVDETQAKHVGGEVRQALDQDALVGSQLRVGAAIERVIQPGCAGRKMTVVPSTVTKTGFNLNPKAKDCVLCSLLAIPRYSLT